MKPYYQYLDFKNLDIIQEKMMNSITSQVGDLQGAGCKVITVDEEMVSNIISIDELMDELEDRGWLRYVILYKLFALEPQGRDNPTWEGGGWPIHTDGNSSKDFLNEYRLVIPIYNTANTKTRFYECSYGGYSVDEQNEGKIKYNLYDEEKCTEIDSYELTRPVLINTNYPHSVDGSTNNMYRISLGISFNKKINFFPT